MDEELRFEMFLSSIAQISREINRIKAQNMREFGLKGTDVMCLYFLAKESLCASDLARKVGVDRAQISRTIAELIDKRILCYDPATATSYARPLLLTQVGHDLAAVIEQRLQEIVKKAGEGLTPDQRESMYESLAIICSNLQSIE